MIHLSKPSGLHLTHYDLISNHNMVEGGLYNESLYSNLLKQQLQSSVKRCSRKKKPVSVNKTKKAK